MFDAKAPIWKFLEGIGSYSLDPFRRPDDSNVVWICEVYPALATVGIFEEIQSGKLLKYNPERRKTFNAADWRAVALSLKAIFHDIGLDELASWSERVAETKPSKSVQDQIDALICLLVGLLRHADSPALCVIGDTRNGYILAPAEGDLLRELSEDSLLESVPLRSIV
jgi:predicted RNase H-like nuclease